MKKLKAIVTKKNGSTKEVYVVVDNETAKMLAQLDDPKAVNDYLAEEYKLHMSDYNEARKTQSLDKSLDSGLDLVDENQNLLDDIIKSARMESVRTAIKTLEPQQQWLVQQIFYKQRTRVDIARELGVNESAIRHRLDRIFEKLKKILI